MTRHDSTLIKSMRRLVRERVYSDPAVWYEYRRERRTRSPSLWTILLYAVLIVLCVPLLLVGIPLIMGLATNDRWGAEVVLACQSYVAAVCSLAFAWIVRNSKQKSAIVTALSHFPATDREIISQVWRQAALIVAAPAYFYLLVYGSIAWNHGFGPAEWTFALLLTIAQWAVSVAAGTMIAAWLPRFPLAALCVVSLVAPILYVSAETPRLPEVVTAVMLVLPTGWVNVPLSWGLLNHQPQAWLALAPLALFCVVGRDAVRSLFVEYTIEEFAILYGDGVEARLAGGVSRASERGTNLRALLLPGYFELPPEEPVVLTPAEAARRIRTRDFLDKLDWSKLGWIERLADRWLTPRERTIVEFLTGQFTNWTDQWWQFVWNIPVLAIFYWSGFFDLVPAAMGLFAFFSVAMAFTLSWPAFRSQNCAGTYVPPFALVPFGFDEISRALFKIALVRSLSVLPFFLVGMVAVTFPMQFWPAEGLLLTLVVFALLVPLVSTFYISLIFNSACCPNLRWRLPLVALGVLGLIVWGLTGISLVIAGLREQNQNGLLVCLAGMLLFLTALGASRYWWRRLYLYGVTDFASPRPSLTEQHFKLQTQGYDRYRRLVELRRQHGWFWWWRGRKG